MILPWPEDRLPSLSEAVRWTLSHLPGHKSNFYHCSLAELKPPLPSFHPAVSCWCWCWRYVKLLVWSTDISRSTDILGTHNPTLIFLWFKTTPWEAPLGFNWSHAKQGFNILFMHSSITPQALSRQLYQEGNWNLNSQHPHSTLLDCQRTHPRPGHFAFFLNRASPHYVSKFLQNSTPTTTSLPWCRPPAPAQAAGSEAPAGCAYHPRWFCYPHFW